MKEDALLEKINLGKFDEIKDAIGKKKHRSDFETILYAVALSETGNLAESEKEYRRLLKKDPANFDAINNLGNLQLRKKNHNEALSLFERAISVGHNEPRHLVRAYVNASVSARNLGLYEKELDFLNKAIQTDSSDTLALRARGVRYLVDKDLDKSILLLSEATKLNPADVEAWINLCAALCRKHDYDLAEEAGRTALQLAPENLIAKANLGIALNGQERFEEAKSLLLDVHVKGLKYHNVYQALATVSLNLEENIEEALNWNQMALDLAPNEPTAIRTKADIVARVDRRASIQIYDQAIAIDPTDTMSHWNASLNLLAIGDFKRGWSEYEWGFKREKHGRGAEWNFNCPRWNGEPLSGKTIVVWGEQGVGDIVMFAHALKEVADEAKLTCLFLPDRLIPVFKRSFPTIHSLPLEKYEAILNSNKRFNFHSPIGSLMRFRRLEREHFANKIPYLFPDKFKYKKFRDRYKAISGGRPIVGLTWQAGYHAMSKKKKSITLEKLKPLLSDKNKFYLSLQYGDVQQELATFSMETGINIFYDEEVDGLKDIDTWFVQICCCDLIISVATAAAHFAGAAGKKVKVIIPSGAAFNWQTEDTKSLWYPQVDIYRQTNRGDWTIPVERLKDDLPYFFETCNIGN